MPRPIRLSPNKARAIWINAQRLNQHAPFGQGASAVARAVEHLGYVQIDTINVIERCHHHILFNRIPNYQRADLDAAQSLEKTVFEYWTHALSFVPISDFRFFVASMKAHRSDPTHWNTEGTDKELRKLIKRVREEGPLTISDIKDDKLVDKAHPWGSKKPSKRALQRAFYNGQLVISQRRGMLKTYELTERHFGWERLPKPATQLQTLDYLLTRALRSQGLITLGSVCYHDAKLKKPMLELIEKRTRSGKLKAVEVEGLEKTAFWASPDILSAQIPASEFTHILSPFDPLIIQRKRTEQFFGYSHLFEAYVPKEKRVMGYFTLPVLCNDEIVAALDLKTDRHNAKLLIQAWHWVGKGQPGEHKSQIETALHAFETFQLGN